MKRRKTFIIAEAGVNHNGSLARALEMVGAAKEAGADAVKFQTFTAEGVACASAPMAEYQKRNMPGARRSQLQMLRRLALPFEDFRKLKRRADGLGIEFISKPATPDAADFLAPLVRIYKISSGEVTNIPFLKHVARKNKPIILSTGMATLKEIAEAVKTIRKYQRCSSRRFPPLTLLQCTTSYPCPPEDANLGAMAALRREFGLPVGFSDHTLGIEVSIAAVALGAEVIEKHFTLDRSLRGPDHKASLLPRELAEMIRSIRAVEDALGDGRKRLMPSEAGNVGIVRKSVAAARNIKAGEKLSLKDLVIKRPAGGIEPRRLDEIPGCRAARDIARDELITWKDIRK